MNAIVKETELITMDVRQAANLLIEKIKTDYKDDIALVVMMGSHLYNDTHAMSDLDMYFIPKTERGYALGFVFIIDGIGFDFWPIAWDRIERIARREEKITSIVTEGHVLYHGTDDDLRRFESLRRDSLKGLTRDDRLNKSKTHLTSAKASFHPFHGALSLTESRRCAIDVLGHLTECLAVLNNTMITRGRGKIPSEIRAMSRVPEGFLEAYDAVLLSRFPKEIKDALLRLISMTESLFKEESAVTEPVPFKSYATGFYEEFVNMYNKIGRAYETGDHRTALHVAREMEVELAWLFADTGAVMPDFPDLIGCYDPNDLLAIKKASSQHKRMFEAYLDSKGVQIRTFKDFGGLKAYLDSL